MSPFVQIGKEPLYYERNDVKPPPVLIPVHGSGGSGAHWPETIRRLPIASVFTPDLPGHGRSTGNGRNSVPDYADIIDAFVAALKLKTVILMGHSLGGAIAMALALRSPPRLSGLILVGTGARLRVTRAILEGLLSDRAAAVDVICELLFGPDAPQSLIERIRKEMLTIAPSVIHGDFTACDQFDMMDRIGKIRLPCLVISGAEDRLTPPGYGEYLCNHIPGARHVVINGAGHMVALEKSKEFVQAVTDFITATAFT